MKVSLKANTNDAGMSRILEKFTRRQLRDFAGMHYIPKGRNKDDTVLNIRLHPRDILISIEISDPVHDIGGYADDYFGED